MPGHWVERPLLGAALPAGIVVRTVAPGLHDLAQAFTEGKFMMICRPRRKGGQMLTCKALPCLVAARTKSGLPGRAREPRR